MSEKKTIKIEFTEPLIFKSNLDSKNQTPFKIELVTRINEILNIYNIEDFFVYTSGETQEIILKINNVSDH